MKGVELYGQVRRAVYVEGMSRREAARRFGIDPRTVAKMLAFSVPPGYRRSRPPTRPKLDPFIGIIDRILEEDKGQPAKQQHTSKRIFGRLRDEHGYPGGITIVKDYVHERRQRRWPEQSSVKETPEGRDAVRSVRSPPSRAAISRGNDARPETSSLNHLCPRATAFRRVASVFRVETPPPITSRIATPTEDVDLFDVDQDGNLSFTLALAPLDDLPEKSEVIRLVQEAIEKKKKTRALQERDDE
jgi:hypothetical protein